MKRFLREFGEKNPENRDKMAKAAKRAIDRGDDSVYHNAYMSLAKGGANKEVLKDFGDKFEKEGLNDQPANNLANNESRNIKGQIKLTEAQLHQVIREAVNSVLNEAFANGFHIGKDNVQHGYNMAKRGEL